VTRVGLSQVWDTMARHLFAEACGGDPGYLSLIEVISMIGQSANGKESARGSVRGGDHRYLVPGVGGDNEFQG